MATSKIDMNQEHNLNRYSRLTNSLRSACLMGLITLIASGLVRISGLAMSLALRAAALVACLFVEMGSLRLGNVTRLLPGLDSCLAIPLIQKFGYH